VIVSYHLSNNGNNKQDYLNLTVWPEKADPKAEVITAQLRRNDGDNGETVGRLAVYRAADGSYSQFPECKE
jgi:hypothetical protein